MGRSDSDTNYNWRTLYSYQRIGTESKGHENKRTSRDHLNYSIVEIGQSPKKSPGDLRRHVVTLTPEEKPSGNAGVKNSQTSKIIIIIIIIRSNIDNRSINRRKITRKL